MFVCLIRSFFAYLRQFCVAAPILILPSITLAAEPGAVSESFGDLFVGSPCNPPGLGMVGCTQKGNTCNDQWQDYFSKTSNSISLMSEGLSDCRTVNSYDKCNFTVGDNGVKEISFDFSVDDSCHSGAGTEWLSFWIYSQPWLNTVEVDFIESAFGPSTGLNTNFAGVGNQVVIFDPDTNNWHGSVAAKFKGSGTNVSVSVTNSHNTNVATSTLTRDSGYFLVMDTATGSPDTCSFTISNLKLKGEVAPGMCKGTISN